MPLALEPESVPKPQTVPEKPRRLSILLVEDDFLIRLNAADLVQELGHEVVEATTAEEALPILESRAFDVLLT
ncbi:MAG: response regulator, partial [Shinella sp.]|nr:response regulator [Shinella sp.]